VKTISIRDMRNVLGHLDSLINTAGELIVTRHGQAIARILPIEGKRTRPTHADLHRLTSKLSTSSEETLRNMRDE